MLLCPSLGVTCIPSHLPQSDGVLYATMIIFTILKKGINLCSCVGRSVMGHPVLRKAPLLKMYMYKKNSFHIRSYPVIVNIFDWHCFWLADVIDPIKDPVSYSDYLEEEDPLLYKSTRTGRGPMKENWLEYYRVDKPPSDVMCAYKLIKVEFRYWGMQVSWEKSHKFFLKIPHCWQAHVKFLDNDW